MNDRTLITIPLSPSSYQCLLSTRLQVTNVYCQQGFKLQMFIVNKASSYKCLLSTRLQVPNVYCQQGFKLHMFIVNTAVLSLSPSFRFILPKLTKQRLPPSNKLWPDKHNKHNIANSDVSIMSYQRVSAKCRVICTCKLCTHTDGMYTYRCYEHTQMVL